MCPPNINLKKWVRPFTLHTEKSASNLAGTNRWLLQTQLQGEGAESLKCCLGCFSNFQRGKFSWVSNVSGNNTKPEGAPTRAASDDGMEEFFLQYTPIHAGEFHQAWKPSVWLTNETTGRATWGPVCSTDSTCSRVLTSPLVTNKSNPNAWFEFKP